MKPASARILVVDDHEPGRYAKSRILRGLGYTVVEAGSGHEALEEVTAQPPDLVLLDVRLPDIDGLTVCHQIKSALPQVTVVQTSSARVDATDRVAALGSGADSYLVEPIDPHELIAVVQALLRMRAAEQEVRRLNDNLQARAAARADELAEANRQLGMERSERRKTEEVLWHVQKLEAVGQLTGGVAHDFNNLLTVITGNLELLWEALSGTRKLSKARLGQLLQSALAAADHGAKLTQQLLAFARRSLLHVEVADLNAIIQRSVDLLRRALGEAVTLEFTPGAELWPCVIDPVKFEAALLNLAVNAHDAMPLGGCFAIQTQNVELSTQESGAVSDIAPGRYVGIVVSDTGMGMEPAVLERIFEPFFTTKDVGRGSGLGLSQFYGFIKQSDGHVTVESTPGAGTTFRLYLPFSSELPQTELPSATVDMASRGRERILVVEDNQNVREVVVELIQDLGYSVLVARDGKEALNLLRGDLPIDLLFTDIVMPNGMDGLALADAARALDARLKIILTSGYAARNGASATSIDFPLILKPYRREDLARVLRDTLDR